MIPSETKPAGPSITQPRGAAWISRTIPQRVEELIRKAGGLRAAARKLELNPTYLLYLRTGERKNPSDETLRKLGLRREVYYVTLKEEK